MDENLGEFNRILIEGISSNWKRFAYNACVTDIYSIIDKIDQDNESNESKMAAFLQKLYIINPTCYKDMVVNSLYALNRIDVVLGVAMDKNFVKVCQILVKRLSNNWKAFARWIKIDDISTIVESIDEDNNSDSIKMESFLETIFQRFPLDYKTIIANSLELSRRYDILFNVALDESSFILSDSLQRILVQRVSPDWKRFARQTGLPDVDIDIEHIDHDLKDDQSKMLSFLDKLYQLKPLNYKDLIEHSLNMCNRFDVLLEIDMDKYSESFNQILIERLSPDWKNFALRTCLYEVDYIIEHIDNDFGDDCLKMSEFLRKLFEIDPVHYKKVIKSTLLKLRRFTVWILFEGDKDDDCLKNEGMDVNVIETLVEKVSYDWQKFASCCEFTDEFSINAIIERLNVITNNDKSKMRCILMELYLRHPEDYKKYITGSLERMKRNDVLKDIESSPEFESQTPIIEESSPEFESQTPIIKESSPEFESQIPIIEESSPEFESQTPIIKGYDKKGRAFSLDKGSSPKFVSQTPIIKESSQECSCRLDFEIDREHPKLRKAFSFDKDYSTSCRISLSFKKESKPEYESLDPFIKESPEVERLIPIIKESSPEYESLDPFIKESSEVERLIPIIKESSLECASNIPVIKDISEIRTAIKNYYLKSYGKVNEIQPLLKAPANVDLCIVDAVNTQIDVVYSVERKEFLKKQISYIPILYSEIFMNDYLEMILISGMAGIGKTWLLGKCLLDWSNDLIWKNVELVFYFECRRLNQLYNISSINELLNVFYKDIIIDFDVSNHSVLFIIDGLDEFKYLNEIINPSLNCSYPIINVLREIQKYKHVVAGRFYAIDQYQSISTEHILKLSIQVMGFNKNGIDNYVENNVIEEKNVVVKAILEESPIAKAMAAVPFYLSCMCKIIVDSKNKKSTSFLTMTDLCANNFLYIFRKHIIKSNKMIYQIMEDSFNKRYILNICKIAYELLVKDKVFFSKEEIQTLIGDLCNDEDQFLGFIERIETSLGYYYHFAHIAIMEFCASVYAYNCLSSKEIMADEKLKNCLSMICGLTNKSQNSLIKFLVDLNPSKKSCEDSLFLFLILDYSSKSEKLFYEGFYESQSSFTVEIKSIVDKKKWCISIDDKKKPYEISCYNYFVNHFINSGRRLRTLYINGYISSDEEKNLLTQCLTNVCNVYLNRPIKFEGRKPKNKIQSFSYYLKTKKDFEECLLSWVNLCEILVLDLDIDIVFIEDVLKLIFFSNIKELKINCRPIYYRKLDYIKLVFEWIRRLNIKDLEILYCYQDYYEINRDLGLELNFDINFIERVFECIRRLNIKNLIINYRNNEFFNEELDDDIDFIDRFYEWVRCLNIEKSFIQYRRNSFRNIDDIKNFISRKKLKYLKYKK